MCATLIKKFEFIIFLLNLNYLFIILNILFHNQCITSLYIIEISLNRHVIKRNWFILIYT